MSEMEFWMLMVMPAWMAVRSYLAKHKAVLA